MSLAVQQLGAGPELVMLHGWGMNSRVLHGFAEKLSESHRVTLIDLPGHGDSPYSGETELAEWALACLAVAPPRAVWLGWSLGVQVALQAALDRPERVVGVIGMAGTPRFSAGEGWPHAMTQLTLDQFISASREDHRKTLQRFLALQVRGGDDSQEQLRQLRALLRECPEPRPQALASGLELLRTVDQRAALPELARPSAWLLCGRDTLVPAELAGPLRELLPASRIELIDKAAHAPFLSHPTQSLEIVRGFLEWFDGR